MNIFYLSDDPRKCAEYHCDKHVVKMIVETAQLLSSAHHLSGTESEKLYKLTHSNHPCAIWTRQSVQNYEWLVRLGLELCKEYTRRYKRRHKTQDVIEWCHKHTPELPHIGFSCPPQAMPEEYRGKDCIVAYKKYYVGEKSRFAVWKYSRVPRWYISKTKRKKIK